MLHTVYRFREVTGHDHSTLITLIYFKSENNDVDKEKVSEPSFLYLFHLQIEKIYTACFNVIFQRNNFIEV